MDKKNIGKAEEVKVVEMEKIGWQFDQMPASDLGLVRNMVCLLSFLFGSRPVQSRPNGPHSLFLPCRKTCTVRWRHLGGSRCVRAISRWRATFPQSFTIAVTLHAHMPASFHIAEMKFLSFCLKYGAARFNEHCNYVASNCFDYIALHQRTQFHGHSRFNYIASHICHCIPQKLDWCPKMFLEMFSPTR